MSISDLHPTDASDVSLIERTRAGDVDAYEVLHTRHVGSAQALARRMSRSTADADDLVSEGFARVLSALQRGKGPDLAFRPYLLSTIRRLAYDRTSREQREAPSETTEEAEAAAPGGDPVLDGFERETAAAAFASLPERWRMVLWHTEVEGQSPTEVGELLGMNPNAVAALAYRAREGLRQAYLTEHTPRSTSGRECERTVARLGAYVRGGLTATREARVRRHLDDCADCRSAHLELANVNSSMPALIGFAVLGPAGASYLAGVSSATVPVSAAFTAAITPIAQAGSSVGGAGVGGGAAGLGAVRVVRRAVSQNRYASAGAAAAAAVAVAVAAAAFQGNPPADGSAAPPLAPEVTAPPTAVEGATATNTSAPATSTSTPATTTSSTRPGDPPVTPVPGSEPNPKTPADTPPAEPPVPSALAVEVRSAGLLVRDRPGVLVATVRNDGEGPGSRPTVRVELEGAGVRAEELATMTAGSASGWTCSAVSAAVAECSHDPFAPGASSSLYVPVTVPGADKVGARVSVSAEHDAARPDATASVDLPVTGSGMAARFATIDRGAIATTGNTLLTCPPADPSCVAALAGGAGAGDNGSFAMEPVDVDGDPATTNSSSAMLDTGRGQVLSATLYWSAGLTAGDGGSPAPDPAQRGRAVMRTPSGRTVEVVAERVDDETGGSRYQAIADVTALVGSGGSGRWTVGGIQLGTGANTYAGWSLVVAYRDTSLPLRSLVVLDGFASVDGSTPVTFDVGGFVVPAGGSGHATLDVVTYEGDATLSGDQLEIDGLALADDANPAGNTFNSSSADRGRLRGGVSPSAVNLLGIDIDRFDVTAALRPGSTSTTISFTTTADRYLTGAVAFTVDQ